MTTTTPNPYPDVPLPDRALWGDQWQREGHRTVEGAERVIVQPKQNERLDDIVIQVWTHAIQHVDGSIDVGQIEPPLISVSGLVWERGITGDTARRLADLLVEAADELDGWTR
jgi:hypothetical protein